MSNLNQQEIIRLMEDFDDHVWAENSKFYKSVMQDGNIFNPYIHRRWIPSQFKRLMHSISGYGLYMITSDRVFKEFNANMWQVRNILKTTTKEIELLSFLEHKDKIAYRERSLIYSFETCKTILIKYGENILNRLYRFADYATVFRKNRYYCSKAEMQTYYRMMLDKIALTKSYKELDECLRENKLYGTFGYEEILDNMAYTLSYSYDRCKDGSFNEAIGAYMLAGAYYSLKSYYMFDKKGKSTIKCQIIRNELEDGKDWKYFLREYCEVQKFNMNL